MRPTWTLLLTLLSYQLVFASPAKRHYSTHDYYVLEHDPDVASLDDIARTLDVEVVEQVGELLHHWLVRAEKSTPGLAPQETANHVLETFGKLRTREASQRDSPFSPRSEHVRSIVSSVKYLSRQVPRQLEKRAPPPVRPPPEESPSDAVAHHLGITDPLFSQQWHIVNNDHPEHMMNVTGLWEMGITGEGVISALVDDGLDYEHEDLAANFYAYGSYDFNGHTDLPTPMSYDDHHGTRCAGQIAAVRNNVCGIGIAYNSKVAGLRILSGPVSDADEAAALNYDFHNTSVYSCSWGPRDNGQTMEGPNYLIQKAVVNGINQGRNGKGSIFVFASGNGGGRGDQCNFDGYTNSIYSVTVSSVDHLGLHPVYSEPCAANMIVSYSSGSGKFIVTTDIGAGKCSHTHGGTSAAAPNAAGVFVLALGVRPDLTWRDIQHLCIETAQPINPEDPDWEATHLGRPYSYKYGFGVIDAYAYVMAAKDWKLVKPQSRMETDAVQLGGGTMDEEGDMQGGKPIVAGGVRSTILVTQAMLEENNFELLEHITVKVWITHTRRGDVEVEVVSPNGIKSVLAAMRKSDSDDTGFPGWTFMSVKHWGEDPIGEWVIRVSDQENESEEGSFLGWSMTFWGSSIDPSKATKYEVPLIDTLLPPHSHPPTATVTPSATTKIHSKPTEALPDEGEKHKPAFPGDQGDPAHPTASPSPSIPTPDEGWFSEMSRLISDRKWFFGAVGAVTVFGIGAAVIFWRRRQAQRLRSDYTTIPAGDDLPMTAIGSRGGPRPRRPRTRELYDAFGEVSDDEDANEETGLRGAHPQDRSPTGLGFHSGFLEDDDPPSAAPMPIYKDEPQSELPAVVERPNPEPGPASPTSGSGDGSWEHAS